MTDRIIELMQKLDIHEYKIKEVKTESAQLYFIKKDLDVRRTIKKDSFYVTVYRDFENGGSSFKGDSSFQLYSTMTDDEIAKTIGRYYEAALFVQNPYYELPETSGDTEECSVPGSGNEGTDALNGYGCIVECSVPEAGNEGAGKRQNCGTASGMTESIPECCGIMQEALYRADVSDRVFINSAELFVEKSDIRIINSKGIDVKYTTGWISGEFVVQCTEPQDVETYHDFTYNDTNAGDIADSFCEAVGEALEMTKMRAVAVKNEAPDGTDVIISGKSMSELMAFYVDRTSAGMLYDEYSNYSTGTDIGRKITVDFKAWPPYSSDGVRKREKRIIEDGIVRNIHGDLRHSYYLKVPYVGECGSFGVSCGTKTLNELKKESGRPYLHIVSFSDFGMDSMTGEFGGEIRLAYYFDGEKEVPVTGGSINLSLVDGSTEYELSSEKVIYCGYEGPNAVRFTKR